MCDPVAKFCSSCNADHGAAGTLPCPSAQKPACQTSGAASGRCTECSATSSAACTGNVVHPTCDVARGMCGCTADAECRVGLYCDSNVAVSGACYFGCRVTSGADHCATGSYCDARDGSIGNCVAEPCLANADCGAGLGCDTSTTPHVCSAAPLADSGVASDASASDASASDASDASDDAQQDVDAAPDAAVDTGGRVDNGGGYGGSGCACTTAHTRASRETSALAAAFALFAVSLVRRRRRQNGVDCSATTSQKRRRAMT